MEPGQINTGNVAMLAGISIICNHCENNQTVQTLPLHNSHSNDAFRLNYRGAPAKLSIPVLENDSAGEY